MRNSNFLFAGIFFMAIFPTLLVQAQSIQNPTPGEAIRIDSIGQGEPVLLLPGFASPGEVWNETVKHLDPSRKYLFVSYAGFNGLQPVGKDWYKQLKEALIMYVRTIEANDLIIVGHSMGGTLATDIAATLPNKVKKIVLVDALPCMREVMMPGTPAENFVYDSPYNQQLLDMNNQNFGQMARMMASNMTTNAIMTDTIAQWMLEADRETWVYGYTDLLRLDLRESVKNVKAEALIIGASLPYENTAKLNFEKQYEDLARKTIVIAPKSKHFVMFDQPEWFYQELNGFLADEQK